MTKKKIKTRLEPSRLRVKKLSDTLFDVAISDDITSTVIQQKDRETGETKETEGYSSTMYAGIIDVRTREKFISECIHIRYSVDDEIALIHKHAAESENSEYTDYQTLRAMIKETASEYFTEGAA